MANAPPTQEAPTPRVEDSLWLDEQGLGTVAIILIVLLLLIVFGVIGFSVN